MTPTLVVAVVVPRTAQMAFFERGENLLHLVFKLEFTHTKN